MASTPWADDASNAFPPRICNGPPIGVDGRAYRWIVGTLCDLGDVIQNWRKCRDCLRSGIAMLDSM